MGIFLKFNPVFFFSSPFFSSLLFKALSPAPEPPTHYHPVTPPTTPPSTPPKTTNTTTPITNTNPNTNHHCWPGDQCFFALFGTRFSGGAGGGRGSSGVEATRTEHRRKGLFLCSCSCSCWSDFGGVCVVLCGNLWEVKRQSRRSRAPVPFKMAD